MNFLRRTRQWTWAVMAWMGMSLLAANVAPLVNTGVPMEVCSASRSGERTADDLNARQSASHGWQCVQCLPFTATASAAFQWHLGPSARTVPEAIAFDSWLAAPRPSFDARAPPSLT